MASKPHPMATSASEYPAISNTDMAGGAMGQPFAGAVEPASDSV